MTQPTSIASGYSRNRDLWWQFTVRAVAARYRGSYLGILWAVLSPLLMLGVYFVVFGIIFSGHFGVLPGETTTDYAMAMFLGLTLYQLVADTLAISPTLVVSNPNFVKKVVFPLEILPLSQVGGLWFNLLIGLILALGGSLLFGRGLPATGLAWLPAILIPLLMASAGLAWFFSALGVFIRDLTPAMQFIAQVVLYASAVFYSPTHLPHAGWAVLRWNPFLQTVVLAREVVLWGLPMSLWSLAYTYVAGLTVLAVGRWTFLRLRPAFADVV